MQPMRDDPIPQESLIDEITRLRHRIATFEAMEADYCQAEKLLRVLEGEEASSARPRDSTLALRVAEQASRMALLTDVSTRMNLAKTEDDVFRVAAHFTPLVVPSKRASIARLTPGGATVEVFALEGEAGIVPLGTELPLDETLIGEALRQQRLVMTPDTRVVDLIDARALSASGLLSIINVPMIASGQPIGTLNVASDRPNAYTAADADLLQQIASVLAANVESRQLLEKTRESLALTEDQATRLALLHEMNQEMDVSRSEAALFEVTMRYTPKLIHVDRVAVTLLTPDHRSVQVMALNGAANAASEVHQFPVAGTLIETVVNTQRVKSLSNLQDSPDNSAMTHMLLQAGLLSISLGSIR